MTENLSDNLPDICETIRGYAPDANLQPVMNAYLIAARAHAGQTRKSGEPYLTHPLAVAGILSNMRMDVDTIATALLHDALEDNPLSKSELTEQMGPTIAELVDGVTKIGKLKFRSKEELQAENFRKMMMAMGRDVRVVLVKLADRLHNMSTLEHHKPGKRATIAQETLDIYVPIANRLGLVNLKIALEDLCFQYLHPEEDAAIRAYLARTAADRKRYIDRTTHRLELLLARVGIKGSVSGRAKHRYSIYRKMGAQNLDVDEVRDLIAFRIIVEELGDCYALLGLAHGQFPPMPERIKDYIARPKPNGYRSLHTTVQGPEDRCIEIQIRTREMHEIAENGIAAHWRYKEGHLALSPDDVASISRIREVLESAQEAETATEFMETVKTELYSNEVYVTTPAGDVKQFRAGATALDFAYAIHTEVGHTCTGAKVNGKLQPIRYTLQSGDSVEILTSNTQRPSRDWLDIAQTGRARSKIGRHLRQQERELGLRIGRDMLEAELKKRGSSLDRISKEGRLKQLSDQTDYHELDDALIALARGQLGLARAVRILLPEPEKSSSSSSISGLFKRFRPRTESPVLITGEDGVLVSYARCCGPLPGEPIAGFITRGRGITVHRQDCRQLASMDSKRRIPVQWDPSTTSNHVGEIQVVCSDRPGLLATISRACEEHNVNISNADVRNQGDGRAFCSFEVSVRGLEELRRLMERIGSIEGVESVSRSRH